MDVSNLLWDFVMAVSCMAHDELKNTQIYQRFECASFLNRSFVMDEASLLNVSYVSEFPRGVAYNHYDGTYTFANLQALLFGALALLQASKNLANNPDALEKMQMLAIAVERVQQHILTADICKKMANIVCN